MITVVWEASEGGIMTWVWEFQGNPSRTDCGWCLEHRLYLEWVGMTQRSEARPHLGNSRRQPKERGLSQAGWGDAAALRGERHTDSVLWEMCPASGSVTCKVIRLVLHVNWVKRPVRCQSSREENQWELFTWQLRDHQEDKGTRKTGGDGEAGTIDCAGEHGWRERLEAKMTQVLAIQNGLNFIHI